MNCFLVVLVVHSSSRLTKMMVMGAATALKMKEKMLEKTNVVEVKHRLDANTARIQQKQAERDGVPTDVVEDGQTFYL